MSTDDKSPKEIAPSGRPDAPLDVGKASPIEVQQALSKLAESKPQKIMELMAMEGSFGGNPLHSKMNEAHITQVLDVAAKHDERQFNLHKENQDNEHTTSVSNRRYGFACFCIIIFVVVLVLILFRHQPQVLIPTITGIGGLVAGGLGGYGFGSRKS